ncbi:MAG TPA: FG-GAP-like repeat-containing protein [Chloroflexia bacterium]|nr:FG-GAP-like repeat-containing protein [Chloroflexia bacterium]
MNQHTLAARGAGTVLILLLGSILAGLHAAQAAPAPSAGPAGPRAGRPAGPAACSPLGFSNNSYLVGGSPDGIALGDFNSDGISDLVTANFASDNVSVLLGNANGTFGNAVSYPAGNSPHNLAVADFFGDRLDDVVTANGGAGTVSILQGNGDGTLTAPYPFSMGNQPIFVAVADLNSDGWPDLVTASDSATEVMVRLGDGIGGFGSATRVPVSGGPYAVAVGDFNRDGRPDLVIADSQIGQVSVLLGNGDGTFQAPINFPVGTTPVAVAVGDLNGDGIPDLAVSNYGAASVSVLLGNGDGLFQPAQTFAVGSDPWGIVLRDLNNDGQLDLVTTNFGFGSNSVSVLLGNGDGTFQSRIDFAVGHAPDALAVGDFNGDGKLDLAIANSGSNSVTVLLNTCVAPVSTPTPPPSATPRPPPTQTPGGPTATLPPPVPTQTPGGPTATAQVTTSPCAIAFADVVPSDYFYTPVGYLACHRVISGYGDGTFRPYANTTRSQQVKIVVLGFAKPIQTPSDGAYTFADVPPTNPFFAFVETAAGLHIVSGYGCGGPGEPCDPQARSYFRPYANVTRGQLSKIDVRAAGWALYNPATPSFSDVPASSPFYAVIQTAVCHSVVSGYVDGTFRPFANATRGQISKIVYLSIVNPPGSCGP